MAQFKAQNPKTEVTGEAILSVINAIPSGKSLRLKILQKHGIPYPQKGEWYPLQSWLNAIKEIYENIGKYNLFLIGKAVIDTALFPPVTNLKEALESIDIAYHMNHRIDKQVLYNSQTQEKYEGIGNYRLTKFDSVQRIAIIKTNSPYPDELDRGVITAIVRRFQSPDSFTLQEVYIDTSQETREKGGETTTFIIHW